jgi:hypothetical protein
MQVTQTLRISKAKVFGYLLLSALFVAGGIWMSSDGQVAGWFCAAFFGIGVLVCTINLLPNSSFLVLDRKGFTIRALYREHSYKWTDVDTFMVGSIGFRRMVVFKFSNAYTGQPRMRAIASALTGAEGALPDTYGLSLQGLADKMNTMKEEALRQNAG